MRENWGKEKKKEKGEVRRLNKQKRMKWTEEMNNLHAVGV